MGHHFDRRKHWRGPEYRMKDIVQREAILSDDQNFELVPNKREISPIPPTVVVLTVIEAVLPDGSTAAEFTVPTLPATVSHSRLGIVTIPAGSMSPIIVSSFPSPQTKIPEPIIVSQPPPSQPSKPSTNISLPSTKHSLPSTNVSLPSSEHSSPSTHIPLPSKPSTNISSPSTIPATSQISTSILPAPPSESSSISSNSPTPSESSTPSTPHSSSPTSKSESVSSTNSSIPSSTPISSTHSSSRTITPSSSSTSVSSTSAGSSSGSLPGGGGGEVTGGQPPAPTQSNGNISKADSGADVPKIVGGIIGGVAGIALIILLLLLLRRIRKRKSVRESHITGGIASSGASASRNTFSTSNTSQLSGSVLGGATRVFDRFRTSSASMAVEPVERGFQKIGGRKLTSVLETGGDGYDDKFGTDEKSLIVPLKPSGFRKETGSRSAVTGGEGSYGSGLHKELGLGQQTSRSPPGRPISDESTYSERVAFRPSPARTPIATPAESVIRGGISTTPHSGIVAPSEPLPTALPPSVRDGIGRSLTDGSRASRFTEGV
ncbi:hypothetical protein MferCBS31731_007139 [Microsporum ferrugineum]